MPVRFVRKQVCRFDVAQTLISAAPRLDSDLLMRPRNSDTPRNQAEPVCFGQTQSGHGWTRIQTDKAVFSSYPCESVSIRG